MGSSTHIVNMSSLIGVLERVCV